MTTQKLIDALNKWDTECEINHEEFLLFIEAARTTLGNETDFITKNTDLTQPDADKQAPMELLTPSTYPYDTSKYVVLPPVRPDAPTKLVEIEGLEEAIHFADNYGDWATVEGYKHFRNLCRAARAYLALTKGV